MYMNRFKKAANFAKKHKINLPPKMKGLKLLHGSCLSDLDMKLVLTEVNFEEEAEVYNQAKKGLAKYIAGRGPRHQAVGRVHN